MRMSLPIVDAKAGTYFGGAEGARIGYATCYVGGSAVDPLEARSPRTKTMKTAKFVVFQGKDNGWYWHLVSANGRVIAQGEGHTRKADAERAIRVVEKTIIRMVSPFINNVVGHKPDVKTVEQIAKESKRLLSSLGRIGSHVSL